MIFAAWVIASLVQLPYVAAGHRFLFHAGKIYCNQDGREPFSTILVSIFGGVPMSIISFCCFKVFWSVRAHTKECFRDVAWNRVNVENIKVARILLVMVLANVICFSTVKSLSQSTFSVAAFTCQGKYTFLTQPWQPCRAL